MGSLMKATQLFLMAYYNFLSGAIFSVIGTSLPDLRCLFNVELDAVSSLFLAIGLAAGVSGLLAVFLIRKFNIYILMTISMLLYTLGTGIVALTHYIYVAWLGLLVAGFSDGAVISCVLVLCNMVFRTETYAFHILSTSVSAGAFLGPVIAQPFLGKQENSSVLHSLATNSSNYSTSAYVYCEQNSSMMNVLYLVMAALGLPLSFGYCISYCVVKPEVFEMREGSTVTKEIIKTEKKGYTISYTLLVALLIPTAYGLAFAYGSFITTLGVQGHLQLGINKSAVMTSVFWLVFSIGRFTSTIVSIFIKQKIVLLACLLGQIASSGFLIWTHTWSEETLWIGTLSLGFFSGPGYAGLITWSRDYISLTPTVLCIYNLMDSVGASVLPFFCGILIKEFGEEAHLLFVLSLCILQMILFLIAYIIGRKIKSDRRKTVDSCVLNNISVLQNGNTRIVNTGHIYDYKAVNISD